MPCTGNICRPLYTQLQKGPNWANNYLTKQGFKVRVSPAFELGLNVVTHMLILFTALTFLFHFVIAKVETKALQGEFQKALSTNLKKALEASNISSNGALKNTLRHLVVPLEVVEKTVQNPDQATENFNDGLLQNAFLIIGIFLAILLTMLITMAYGAGVPVKRVFTFVLISTLFAFVFVAGTEWEFFRLVATKYIPTKPSLITESIVSDIKNTF
jgi:hypothetical protein